jgi:hypothetical protein
MRSLPTLMLSRSSPLRRPNAWRRKLALAALFAIQGAIAVSPLLEPTEKGRLGAHTEERGAQHKYQHDEATCAVCSVRAMHSSPAQASPAVACERESWIAALGAPRAPNRRVDPTTLPRAPPRLT